MSRWQPRAIAKSVLRNFHVPLSDVLYDALRGEAARVGRPATDVARDAIAGHLHALRRADIDRAVTEYARAQAGSSGDLDVQLEAAGVEHLVGRRERRK